MQIKENVLEIIEILHYLYRLLYIQSIAAYIIQFQFYTLQIQECVLLIVGMKYNNNMQ